MWGLGRLRLGVLGFGIWGLGSPSSGHNERNSLLRFLAFVDSSKQGSPILVLWGHSLTPGSPSTPLNPKTLLKTRKSQNEAPNHP